MTAMNTTLSGSTYDSTVDVNSDTRKDELVLIPNSIQGRYKVRLDQKLGAPDSARFTLSVRIDGNQEMVPNGFEDAAVSSLGGPLPDTVAYCANLLDEGNCDGGGAVTSADIIFMVNHVFKLGPAPGIPFICDVNCTETLTSADIIVLVNYVFKSGPKGCSQTLCQ